MWNVMFKWPNAWASLELSEFKEPAKEKEGKIEIKKSSEPESNGKEMLYKEAHSTLPSVLMQH